jgi:Tn7-like transposition protein D/TniQ
MIGHFPDPHPDELLYSVFARYSDQVNYPSKKSVVHDLFGTWNVLAVVDFPSHLDSLIAALPPECNYTADSLIDNHTLLPFYGPFLPAERLELIRHDMHGDRGTAIPTRVGTVASNIPLPRWLRFCPQCVEEDRKNWGDCYWHRVHHAPNVFVCPVHAVCLQDSDVPIRNARTRYEFISAEHLLRTATKQVSTQSHSYDKMLLRIAEDTMWLLKQHRLTCGPEALQKKYIAVLAEHGLLTSRGKARVDALVRSFKGFYSSELLGQLHCNIDENMRDSWVTRLLRPGTSLQQAQHPIHHMLLIHFLGYQIEAFLNVSTERRPFGEGPWPCLNRACDHYLQLTISRCSITYDPKTTGGVIGTFSCHCGFTYTRKGPDTSNERQYQISSIKSRGDIWKATLQRLWEDPTMNLDQAAILLGVTRKSVTHNARLLGLSFPRPFEKLRHKESIPLLKEPCLPEKDLEEYRALWVAALEEFPGERLQVLWAKPKLSGIYRRLHKYDFDWLKAHIPSPQMREKSQGPVTPRVDWAVRDAQLAERVEEAALRLRDVSGCPKQVSLAAIGRDLDALALLQKRLQKLPLTACVLSAVTETHEDCGIRRIWWARGLYQNEGILPTRQQLARRAYVRNMIESPRIQEAIDEALSSFHVKG